jgi:hypothetical protein
LLVDRRFDQKFLCHIVPLHAKKRMLKPLRLSHAQRRSSMDCE